MYSSNESREDRLKELSSSLFRRIQTCKYKLKKKKMKNLLNIELDLNDWDDSSSECLHKKCLFDKAVELLAIF